jgi:hypothetical protein
VLGGEHVLVLVRGAQVEMGEAVLPGARHLDAQADRAVLSAISRPQNFSTRYSETSAAALTPPPQTTSPQSVTRYSSRQSTMGNAAGKARRDPSARSPRLPSSRPARGGEQARPSRR